MTATPPGDGWIEVDPASPVTPFWEPGTYDRGTLMRDAGQTWRALADDTDGPAPPSSTGGWSLTD